MKLTLRTSQFIWDFSNLSTYKMENTYSVNHIFIKTFSKYHIDLITKTL